MVNRKAPSPTHLTNGVETLISRLCDQGLAKGRSIAQQVVRDAQTEAELILETAKVEAEQMVRQASKETEIMKRGGQEALQIAGRDAMLALITQLSEQFTKEVQHLVATEIQKPELVIKMILEIAGRTPAEVSEIHRVETLLPRQVNDLEELRRNTEELERGILTYFVQLVSQDMFRQGVTWGTAEDNQGLFKLYLVEQDMQVDLNDQAIVAMLLHHIQPRFRALIEGIAR